MCRGARSALHPWGVIYGPPGPRGPLLREETPPRGHLRLKVATAPRNVHVIAGTPAPGVCIATGRAGRRWNSERGAWGDAE